MKSKTLAITRNKCRAKNPSGRNQHAKRQTQSYWEAKLTRMGLSMEAGRLYGADGEDLLIYGHDVTVLDFDGRNTYENGSGQDE